VSPDDAANPRRLPARSRPGRRALAAVGLALAVASAVWSLTRPRPTAPTTPATRSHAPPDPRLLYDGPYRNIRPEVAYVGDAACVSCHSDIAESFRRHPMGMSLAPIAEVVDRDVYDAAHRNPFVFQGSRFEVERHGSEVRHRETRLDAAGHPVCAVENEVQYVIGSGLSGRSYLTLCDGCLFQTIISWYTPKQIWDISPGFRLDVPHLRPVGGECLFCHANRARFRENTVNRYDRPVFDGHAIGCERCHGPGELHARTAEPLDVVNPGKLAPALREAVCEQCHLEGAERVLRRGRGLYDFRPGLPLEDFWAVFVREAEAGKDRKAVTHVEQMHLSRCWQGSQRGPTPLGCVSCHDPHVHVGPAERVAWFRQRCLKCHAGAERGARVAGCSLPTAVRRQRQADDSCIACHMPRFSNSDVVHSASTDHTVVRHASLSEKPEGQADRGRLVPFHRSRLAPPAADLGRDRGIALANQLAMGKEDFRRFGPMAIGLLEEAIRNDPDDLAAWEAKGLALNVGWQAREALATMQNLLSRAPEHEGALEKAALFCEHLGLYREARDYGRRAVAANPGMVSYRRALLRVLVQLEAWDEVRDEVEACLRLDPTSVEVRKSRVTCLLREGNKDGARAEFARIEALQPPDAAGLRAWFARQVR
jgi:hypothetical protein